MRSVDSLADARAQLAALRPLRTFTDLEHERDEWQQSSPHVQLSLTEELS